MTLTPFWTWTDTPPVGAHTLLAMSAGTVRSRVIGVRGASLPSSQCRRSSDPVVLKPAPARLPGPRLQSRTLTHRWVDLLLVQCGIVHVYFLGLWQLLHVFFQRERLVLILVCAGAGVIVVVAVISAVFAVKRVVYRNRWARCTSVLGVHLHADNISWPLWFNVALCRTPAYRFSNLRIQDDDSGITADPESATSSNGRACQQDSDDVGVVERFCF